MGETELVNSEISNTALVSIVINNYNYERFLGEAIDSALNQTYAHTEIIVIDDGSTDGSREIIKGYGDRITAIFQENGKQGAALNNGFAASHGEIVLFLDSDDYLLPMAVEKIVAVWRPGVSKIHYRLQVVDTDGQPTGTFIPTTTVQLASGNVSQKLIQTSGYVSTCMSGNAYNRQCLSQVFPIPDEYKTTADDYLMISTPFYGELIAIEDPLAVYRIHTSNQWALSAVTGSRFRRFVEHDLQNFALLQQRAREFGHDVPADVERRSFARLWSRLASLRLEPKEHPVPSDRSLQLTYWGICSLWQFSGFNWQKRSIYSLWFLWVGLMPKSLAHVGITWLQAPHLRPKVIDWTLTKLRALVS
jgi:glycosyltransferase involved in cell wall biosynthesis